MADNQNTQPNTGQNDGGNNANQNGGNGSDKTYTQQELDNIVNERTGRATKSALTSFFKQKGLSAEEANSAIAKYLDEKKKNTPDATQLQADLTAANTARVKAVINQAATLEAVKQGVDVKSIPYLLKMADFKNVIGEDGAVDAEKLTEAITTVLTDIPAFKADTNAAAGGVHRIGGDGTQQKDTSEDTLRKIFGVK